MDTFTLYYKAKSSDQWIVRKGIKGRDSMTLKNLQPFTAYQFRVFALNHIGTSKPSPLAEFTTSQKGLFFKSVLPSQRKFETGKNSQFHIYKILQNKHYRWKVLLNSFHLNGHTLGFHSRTQTLQCTLGPSRMPQGY